MGVAVLACGPAACGPVESEQVDPLELLASDGPPIGAERAIQVVLGSYVGATELVDAPAVEVRWVSEPIPYDGDMTASGLTVGCTSWVVWRAGDRFPRVLLAHELAHCARRTLTGNGDGGHGDPAWWGSGGLVDQAALALARAGI